MEKVIIFNWTRTFFTLFNRYGNNKGRRRTRYERTLKGYKEIFINRNGKAYNINKTWCWNNIQLII